jgi:hypothetical protein
MDDKFHMQVHEETSRRLGAVESACAELKSQVARVHGAVWVASGIMGVASIIVQIIK